jgi:UPF0755 protein
MKVKLFITLMIGFFLGLSAYFVLTLFYDFEKGPAETKTIFIPKNSPVSQAAKILADGGVIKSAAKFKILVSLMGKSKSLRPGEYEFALPDDPVNILKKITQGKVKTYRVTVPEGLTFREVATIFQEQELADASNFSSLLYDEEIKKKFSIEGPSLEGYLYPETYVVDKTMSEKDIVLIMINRFFKEVSDALMQIAKQKGMSREDVVTLASMIEKETGIDSERELISSVFHNRLKKGMRLQCDPTVIYGIIEEEKTNPSLFTAAAASYRKIRNMFSNDPSNKSRYSDYRGNLTKKHLTTYTPYNTYMIKGLPKGPISNPGLASIKAAIFPLPTKFLYFVSRNDGSHIFSETYTQHLDGVRKFQKSHTKK